MSTAAQAVEPRRNGRPLVTIRELRDLPSPQASRAEKALTLADLMRTIAVIQAAGWVESDLADNLRTMAARVRGEAAARLLRLAEDAARAAQVAASTSDHLQEQVRQWTEHADQAQAVHHLPQTDASKTQPVLTAPADTGPGQMRLDSITSARLTDIAQRLTELRQARPKLSGDGRVPEPGHDPAQRSEDARRRAQQSVAHLQQARQLSLDAFDRAASAHDRAAEAYARSACAGVGDVAEHKRRAALHRTAADADRQQADAERLGLQGSGQSTCAGARAGA